MSVSAHWNRSEIPGTQIPGRLRDETMHGSQSIEHKEPGQASRRGSQGPDGMGSGCRLQFTPSRYVQEPFSSGYVVSGLRGLCLSCVYPAVPRCPWLLPVPLGPGALQHTASTSLLHTAPAHVGRPPQHWIALLWVWIWKSCTHYPYKWLLFLNSLNFSQFVTYFLTVLKFCFDEQNFQILSTLKSIHF